MENISTVLLSSLLMGALIFIVCLLFKERRIDREIAAKEKFLKDNPPPKKMIKFILHDN